VSNVKAAQAVPDETLIEQGRRGDARALGRLVDRHYPVVYRVAVSVVSDPDLAADVTQDTVLKAVRGLDRFRGDAAFRTWLLSIAYNEAKAALRRRGRKKETPLEDAAPVASAGRSPEEEAVTSREAARARAMLEELPEKQRLSVALRIDEGLSFREIGELIGSSEGAARVNYFHGIRKLRERMT
jgi:RNA polymerase sigma-70 factor (ECF subfamily)